MRPKAEAGRQRAADLCARPAAPSDFRASQKVAAIKIIIIIKIISPPSTESAALAGAARTSLAPVASASEGPQTSSEPPDGHATQTSSQIERALSERLAEPASCRQSCRKPGCATTERFWWPHIVSADRDAVPGRPVVCKSVTGRPWWKTSGDKLT